MTVTPDTALHAGVASSRGHYGRPQYVVSCYDQRINAGGMATFESRAAAAAWIAIGRRDGWMERPDIHYREDYATQLDHDTVVG